MQDTRQGPARWMDSKGEVEIHSSSINQELKAKDVQHPYIAFLEKVILNCPKSIASERSASALQIPQKNSSRALFVAHCSDEIGVTHAVEIVKFFR